MYIAFKTLSYYLFNAKVIIKCDYALLHIFLIDHTLNLKVNNWETEIASMSNVTFQHFKGTTNILSN